MSSTFSTDIFSTSPGSADAAEGGRGFMVFGFWRDVLSNDKVSSPGMKAKNRGEKRKKDWRIGAKDQSVEQNPVLSFTIYLLAQQIRVRGSGAGE